jgi:poly-gamma-glutamate synthesis protein (capsule biosynthesis protein)
MEALAFLLLALSAARAQPAAPPASATAPVVEVVMTAAGDIRLDGAIATIARGDPGAPSRDVQKLLAADIVFANLETPITTRGSKTPKKFNFRARPEYLKIVRAAGVTVVNIANNHVWDYGAIGFNDTLKALELGHWNYVGGGRDRARAEEVRLFKFEGLTIGIVGLTSTHPEEAWAGPRKPGVAYSDFNRIDEIVRRAKKRCDVLVVSFHGGTELADDPNDIQKSVAHAAIAAGADIFLGHHPHVLQPVEIFQGKPIVYSLGNFLFVSPSPLTRPETIARIVFDKSGVKRLTFASLDGNGGRPRPASAEVAEQVRAALDRLGAFEARPDLLGFETATP